jgi:hypothetical protein
MIMKTKPQKLFTSALIIILGLTGWITSNASGTQWNNTGPDGSVRGTVKYEGSTPVVQKYQVEKDPNTCTAGTREIQEVKVDANGGLAGAVVFLEGVDGSKKFETPEGGYILNQLGCHFVPHILIVPYGADVITKNSDPVFHTTSVYQIMGKVRRTFFSVALPQQNQKITKKIDPQNSNILKVECDLHNFMHAWILTVKNPYYTFTDASGNFKIDDIPPGKYLMKVWNPTLQISEQEVEIEVGKETTVNVNVSR